MKKSLCRYQRLLGGIISTLLLVASAEAGTLTVNSAADSGGSCPGADCTLRQAIQTAASGDTINFATGLATIELTSGDLLINKNLRISGPGPNLLTVQRSAAKGTPNFRIFSVWDSNLVVNIVGLTILNGSVSSDNGNGGAILNGGTLTITACVISGSSSESDGGGAIFNNGGDPGGTLTITNTTISGNTTSGVMGGGGIFGGGRITIINSTISGNSAGNGTGGGIYVVGSRGATIQNSTISGNSAMSGGGITFSVAVNLSDSTVSGNSAGEGGGFRSELSRRVTLRNTIIARNTAAIGPDGSGLVYSMGYNLIGNTSGVSIDGAIEGNQLNVDPLLGPLQDNGGSTQTHALLSGSSAINKGNSSGSVADQRGFTRPVGTASITGGDGSDIGAFESQATTGTPGTLGNISTRLRVETGEGVLIGGFIITGTQPKRIIVRAIGPSLPVTGTLGDPTLELRDSAGGLIASNDNWRSDQESEIIATTIPPSNDSESAIVATLPANTSAYTAIVRGVSGGTGIGVVEAYDLDQTADSRLANISTRGLVQTGDNVLIGGLIAVGQNPLRVIVRAIGPSLPVTGTLGDPTLELHDNDGTLVAYNDNWRTDQEGEIIGTTIPPSNDLESAIVRNLTPGNYTAIVNSVNGTTGVALVEVYELN